MEMKPLEITKLKRFCETRQGSFFNYFVSPDWVGLVFFLSPALDFQLFQKRIWGKQTNKTPTFKTLETLECCTASEQSLESHPSGCNHEATPPISCALLPSDE